MFPVSVPPIVQCLVGLRRSCDPPRNYIRYRRTNPYDPPVVPMDLPASGEWLVRILAREGRFVIGLHRRQMRAIGQLGALDRVFAAPGAIRNWTTFQAIGRVLGGERR